MTVFEGENAIARIALGRYRMTCMTCFYWGEWRVDCRFVEEEGSPGIDRTRRPARSLDSHGASSWSSRDCGTSDSAQSDEGWGELDGTGHEMSFVKGLSRVTLCVCGCDFAQLGLVYECVIASYDRVQ